MKRILILSGVLGCFFLSQGVFAQEKGILTPETLSAEVVAGDSVTERKELFLPQNVTPQRADIIFVMDLTGSMGGELKEVKAGAVSMMNKIATIIPDVRFGLISHMDYPEYYESCGYSNSYGSSGSGDYPYKRDVPLTTDRGIVKGAIDALVLGYGSDGPESYTRVLYELYSDSEIQWRENATKIVLFWNDHITHACNPALGCSGLSHESTGADPGRDGIMGTADDLKQIMPVLEKLAEENIALITLHSGDYLDYWKCYSETTGGSAFQLNWDGTVPDGTDIASYVASIVEEKIQRVSSMTLQICTEEFEDWPLSVVPSEYKDVIFSTDQYLRYDIDITVPEDTAPGRYAFTVCAVGDGAKYAGQNVIIDVPDTSSIQVPLDIEPGSCPNLVTIDTVACASSCGVVQVAILGTATFDVAAIDTTTLSVLGLKPISGTIRRGRTSTPAIKIEDVGTPYWPYIGKTEETECNADGPDGYKDLTFMLDKQQLLSALGNVADGDVVTVKLDGQLKDGTSIIGEDVVRFRIGGRATR